MPTLYQSKAIKVTLSGTGTIGGQRAKVINRTTGEKHPTATKFSANKILVFDVAEFASGYSAGDIIDVSTNGPAFGNVLITLTADGKNQTDSIAATAESSTLPAGGN